MSARARVAAVLASLAVLLSPVLAPAMAAADESPSPDTGGAAATPAEEIAEALAESPVYVDPAYDTPFPETKRERVEEQIADGPFELYVIVIPLASGDPWDGDPEALITAVNDRMGGGERHFLAYDQSYEGGLVGNDFGSESAQQAFYGALASDSIHMGTEGVSISDRVESAIEVAYSDDPQARYEQASADYEERNPGYGMPWWQRGWALWTGLGVVVLLLAGMGFLLLRRRGSPDVIPQHAAFDNADRAQLESLVERGERDLIELGERLSAATGVPERHMSRALDARDAAARVHDQMVAQGPTLADAAGVLVLLDLAEDALAGRNAPRMPCYANPLHGSRTRSVQWREFGGTRSVNVPLCAECAKAVRNRVRPTVLPAEHEGRSVPYYELSPEESVWAATGFGTLTDDLVQRILTGQRR